MPQIDLMTQKLNQSGKYHAHPASLPTAEPFAEKKHGFSDALEILAVDSGRRQREFLRLPWSIHSTDPAWVPPLLAERYMLLSPENPYFEHAEARFWLACRRGTPVGRISAQIDRLHLEHHDDRTGFFGLLAAEDNLETFKALLNAAEGWLRSRGMAYVQGPYNLSVNQECGTLVAGFHAPPMAMMGHDRPHVGCRIEQCGYQGVKDLLAYIIDADFRHSRAMDTMIRRTRKRIHTRTIGRASFDEDVDAIRRIFNDAWSLNWGFVPFTQHEFEHLGKVLKLLVGGRSIRIAEVDGTPSAFMVMLPNLNEAIRDLDGRLMPFGWSKLLWRLKIRHPKTARIPLMGVVRRYHGTLLGAAMAYRLIGELQETAIGHGIKTVELSWILDDNIGMRGIIENIGGKPYKTYRIYGKKLQGM